MESLLLLTLIPVLYWLLRETDYLRIRLLIGDLPEPDPVIELERLTLEQCISRYGRKQLQFSPGVDNPLCGWDWLNNNTHPVPQVDVRFESGGVRYHWKIKDCNILKNAITATHAKPKKSYGQLHFKRNKYGGLVAPLPAK